MKNLKARAKYICVGGNNKKAFLFNKYENNKTSRYTINISETSYLVNKK